MVVAAIIRVNVSGFIETIQNENLTLPAKSVELDNHIIQYVCKKCSLPETDKNYMKPNDF